MTPAEIVTDVAEGAEVVGEIATAVPDPIVHEVGAGLEFAGHVLDHVAAWIRAGSQDDAALLATLRAKLDEAGAKLVKSEGVEDKARADADAEIEAAAPL